MILASQSPRRKELLAGLGYAFSVVPSRVEESAVPLCRPAYYVKRLARVKGEEVFERTGGLVIASDTIVVLDDRILGKPANEPEAQQMLRALSGRWHTVYTGLFIKNSKISVCCQQHTRVKFRLLSDEDIARYVKTGEPMDKAGSYGIQGRGAALVERIVGDYFTVMGLPVCLLGQILQQQFGLPLF